MKRLLLLTAALVVVTGCSTDRNSRNPYENPFYAKYLNTGSVLDSQIRETLVALQQNPDSPELHNTLGSLLIEKGFPKDAEREFERAVNLESEFYPAWYNLGLVRASRGDELGSRRALNRAVDLKPGHAAALFQLGLVEEERGHVDRAVELYAKAFAINPALLEVDVNPRILDTKLIHLALLHNYPAEHAKKSMQFQGGTIDREVLRPQEAPSPQPPPQTIVPPAAPVTDPAMQPAPKPAAPKAAPAPPARRQAAPPPPPPAEDEGVIGGPARQQRPPG